MRKVCLLGAMLVCCWALSVTPSFAQSHGKVHTYFVAADEVEWNYAPQGMDKMMNMKFMGYSKVFTEKGEHRIGTTYLKALYREYTDDTFTKLKPRGPEWEHLGILGPVLRAEVGDTIKVVFKNNASRPYSMHPHGVFYDKASEGSGYADGTNEPDKNGVPPGKTHIYTWEVPERAGPGPSDPSSIVWLYHSHADEPKDVESGLIGTIIITRKGMAGPTGKPKDVDREFVAMFGAFDEHQSWYWNENLKRLYGDPKNYDDSNTLQHEFHHFFSINGFLDGNGPMFTMRKGERVRWYLFAPPNEVEIWDVHTAHWHGQTAIVNHMRMDMVPLQPMESAVADMVPDNPGIWMFHCHMPGHFAAGMRTRFQVLP